MVTLLNRDLGMRCRLAGTSSWTGRVFENKRADGTSRGALGSRHAGAHTGADAGSDRPDGNHRAPGSVAFGHDSRSYAEAYQGAD